MELKKLAHLELQLKSERRKILLHASDITKRLGVIRQQRREENKKNRERNLKGRSRGISITQYVIEHTSNKQTWTPLISLNSTRREGGPNLYRKAKSLLLEYEKHVLESKAVPHSNHYSWVKFLSNGRLDTSFFRIMKYHAYPIGKVATGKIDQEYFEDKDTIEPDLF